MKWRILAVVLAFIFGMVGAYAAIVYLNGVETTLKKAARPVTVIQARQDIPKGTTADEIASRDLFEKRSIPREYASPGALSSLAPVSGMILAVSLTKGEQFTATKFQEEREMGLSFSIPAGMVAVSVPVDDMRGVAGFLKAGDKVDVLATFTPSGGKPVTRILLQKVEVLAVGSAAQPDTKSRQSTTRASTQKQTITLSVTASDAEKVVFAQEEGTIWIALLPAKGAGGALTQGRSHDNVFK